MQIIDICYIYSPLLVLVSCSKYPLTNTPLLDTYYAWCNNRSPWACPYNANSMPTLTYGNTNKYRSSGGVIWTMIYYAHVVAIISIMFAQPHSKVQGFYATQAYIPIGFKRWMENHTPTTGANEEMLYDRGTKAEVLDSQFSRWHHKSRSSCTQGCQSINGTGSLYAASETGAHAN